MIKLALQYALMLAPLAGIAMPTHAEGLFGGSQKLDPAFCQPHNIRQTIIYIDDTILVTGNTNWAVTTYNKLKATLVPGERTTLVELSPDSGQNTEVWSGCWPAYTAEQTAKIANQSYFFSTSPLAALKDQQGFFAHDFGVAAETIEAKRGRTSSAVSINPSDPPQKSILRALASDARAMPTATTRSGRLSNPISPRTVISARCSSHSPPSQWTTARNSALICAEAFSMLLALAPTSKAMVGRRMLFVISG
jgi:hypothetical protein